MRKKYRFVDGRGFFEYTLAYAQEEITKFDRFVVYSFSDIPDNYSIQCDFAHTSVDFNGIDIDIKCLVAWTVSIRPCELEKIAAIAGYEVTVRSYNTFYRAMMKFLSKKGMNLLDILLADENDYDIYSEQVQIGQTSKFAEVFNKLRDIIINDKSGCNIIRYLISFLRNDVIRDQLADCPNNRLSYLYLKNEAIPFDEMPYASSLYKHNVTTSRLHRCLDIDDCEHQYLSAMVNEDNNVKTLGDVLKALGDPLSPIPNEVTDLNYPTLVLPKSQVTDHQYIYELAPFEWKTAERLKRDKGYMGKMSFPENLEKPARTVMATMSASSREAMILEHKEGKYRLPTVREAASMMSFPIDYWFYGKTKSIKHTLVGNAVPPKLSYAIAKAIALKEGESIPEQYPPIQHDEEIAFVNLNGNIFPKKKEKERRSTAKFKYHIPYLIQAEYRVELTNYHSDFGDEHRPPSFKWDAEIHYSQGKDKARVYTPDLSLNEIDENLQLAIKEFICQKCRNLPSYNDFQVRYCMTTTERKEANVMGPYELLDEVKAFIVRTIPEQHFENQICLNEVPHPLPLAIAVGYIILNQITHEMGGK